MLRSRTGVQTDPPQKSAICPPNMKKQLLLPLFIVLCLVGDISVIATAATEQTLTNISTRAFVQTRDNVVIGGFFVQGL